MRLTIPAAVDRAAGLFGGQTAIAEPAGPRISYAELGINQLGAVYEGLLSYSGFFAQERLYEVKPAGASPTDETQQS